jgi:hypothetical protein
MAKKPKQKEYSRTSPILPVVLNTIARDFVGDASGVNVYFVSDEHGDVVTITYDRDVAVEHWRKLADRRPLVESTLEDRHTGVLASVEPEIDAPGALLRIYDVED